MREQLVEILISRPQLSLSLIVVLVAFILTSAIVWTCELLVTYRRSSRIHYLLIAAVSCLLALTVCVAFVVAESRAWLFQI